MIYLVNILVVVAAASIFVLVGFGWGMIRQRARSINALREMQRTAQEVMPVAPVFGIGAVFAHGQWMILGDPPRRMRKHGWPECGACNHWGMAHRPTLTVVSTTESAIGDEVPVVVSLVCRKKNCGCIVEVGAGTFTIEIEGA